jgi:phage terminase large subunit GpA-like protein
LLLSRDKCVYLQMFRRRQLAAKPPAPAHAEAVNGDPEEDDQHARNGMEALPYEPVDTSVYARHLAQLRVLEARRRKAEAEAEEAEKHAAEAETRQQRNEQRVKSVRNARASQQ